MDFLYYHFPTSGVETYLFIPPLVMFLISTFVSLGGVTGAFILLPFQMSVLGYTAPGVSATNFIYNIIAIPIGVYKKIRQKQMCWALFWILMIGTLPGVFIGYYFRIFYLPDPAQFKPFVGAVLGLLATRLVLSVLNSGKSSHSSAHSQNAPIHTQKVEWLKCTVSMGQGSFRLPIPLLGILSFIVGIVGGAYGIGGGAFLAPFCISALNLPPSLVAGATLFSTWVTSVLGALIYAFIPLTQNANTSPDLLLGVLFGIGGMAGIYTGSFLQHRVPIKAIKIILAIALGFIAVRYLTPGLSFF